MGNVRCTAWMNHSAQARRTYAPHRADFASPRVHAGDQEGGAPRDGARHAPAVALDQVLALHAPQGVQLAAHHEGLPRQALQVALRDGLPRQNCLHVDSPFVMTSGAPLPTLSNLGQNCSSSREADGRLPRRFQVREGVLPAGRMSCGTLFCGKRWRTLSTGSGSRRHCVGASGIVQPDSGPPAGALGQAEAAMQGQLTWQNTHLAGM